MLPELKELSITWDVCYVPFQKGNKAAAGHTVDKIWANAVKRACMRALSPTDKAQRLDRLAEKLIDEGLAGNTVALKEIGDRLDGRPMQAITAQVETQVNVSIVRYGSKPTA